MNLSLTFFGKLSFILTLFFISSTANLSASSVEAETKAPDFSLKDVNGKDLSLSSYKGKVIVLAFWATWCPSCKDEMPKLQRLYHEMKSRGLEVIAVSSDYSEDSLKEYLSKNSFDFHILYDGKRSVTRQYKLSFLPVTFLIDRNGVISDKIPGEFDWPSPETKIKIEKLLKK
jgi:peroxiredoxin